MARGQSEYKVACDGRGARSKKNDRRLNEEVRMRFDLLIFRRIFATLLLLGAVVMLLSMAHPLRGQTTNSSIVTSLKYNLGLLSLLPEPVLDPVVDPPGNFHAVKPQGFAPGKTS